MKRKSRKLLGAALVVVMAVTMMLSVPAVTYADSPVIYDCSGDQWLYPGQDTEANIYLNEPVDDVDLMIWKDDSEERLLRG